MMIIRNVVSSALCLLVILQSCKPQEKKEAVQEHRDTVEQTAVAPVSLPEPYTTKSVKNFSKVVGWPEGRTPQAPEGFLVAKYVSGLNNPRWIYDTQR